VRVVRYEDVVADPEGALRGIADWIGVGFDPAMLEVALVNSSGSAFAAKAGVSADPLERWRAKLSDGEVHVIQRVAAGPMARLGYAPQPVQAGALALPRAWAGVPFAAVRAVRANSGRAGNVPAYIWRRIRAAMR
jgi:hypothetical protein